MFSIANLLDSAKARASIESDYRLAKVIGKSHQVISGYRSGKSLPEESVIEQICSLSGDDSGVVAAQIQAARSKSPEAVNMWLMIAQRLAAASGMMISQRLAAGTGILVSANEKAPELVGDGASPDWRKRTVSNPSVTRESSKPAANLSAAMRSFFPIPPSPFA
jgi:hypothetical protein